MLEEMFHPLVLLHGYMYRFFYPWELGSSSFLYNIIATGVGK
jgi:hypothetical protein